VKDALPPILWLWHNKRNGRLFASKRQTIFTVINSAIVLLGLSIVSDVIKPRPDGSANAYETVRAGYVVVWLGFEPRHCGQGVLLR
jgi:hypothetical protein